MGRPQRFRGVRQRHWGSWVSEIRHPLLKTRVWLGTFETAEDAAHAYDEAARLMCGVKARTNFPYDPHAPKRPGAQLLSATLTAKLHRWYLQSQQQAAEPNQATSGKTKGSAASQSLTCLCLDAQQSNLGIVKKSSGSRHDEPNWVRNVEFATTTSSSEDHPQPSTSSTSSESAESCLSEDDKFAAEMIQELLSWHSPGGHLDFSGVASPATSDSTCTSSLYHTSTFVM